MLRHVRFSLAVLLRMPLTIHEDSSTSLAPNACSSSTSSSFTFLRMHSVAACASISSRRGVFFLIWLIFETRKMKAT